jgi:hypothetical protein
MARTHEWTIPPAGGIHDGTRGLRHWRWGRWTNGLLTSTPLRCGGDQWYLIRARPGRDHRLAQSGLTVLFQQGSQILEQRYVRLCATDGSDGQLLLGWVHSPPHATRLSVQLEHADGRAPLAHLTWHAVAERHPKCHPLANVPRWSTMPSSACPQRLVLPRSLEQLSRLINHVEPQVADAPGSIEELRALTRGATCVLDPAWLHGLGVTWAQLERLAEESWILLDLATAGRLLQAAHVADCEVVWYTARHGLMSARVEYSDVQTRGFAMKDVLPYGIVTPAGRFAVRVLRAKGGWRQYADDVGFATLLSSLTPWERRSGDVLCAARPTAGGELMITDLPWLLSGAFGQPAASHVAAHLLRMHVGAPLPDAVQYWNRWEDMDVVVRDLADVPHRCPPLKVARWATNDPRCARLGIVVTGLGARLRRHTIIQTGRIDAAAAHGGLPPEPMTIFMKWLAREVREQTNWARRHLTGRVVTWQFDTVAGLKYVCHFDSAAWIGDLPVETVNVRLGPEAVTRPRRSPPNNEIWLNDDEGLLGDRSLCFQEELTRRLCAWLERH